MHILPHIFLPVIHLLDGRERDVLVSDVGPMYGLERGVLKQFASVHLERFKSLRESGELEGHVGSQQTELLVGQAALPPDDGYRKIHFVFAPKEVRQRLLKQADFKPSTPVADKRGEHIAEELGSGDLRGEGGVDDGRVAQVFETLVAVHELGFDAFGARVDDLAVGEVEEQEVIEGLAAMARMDAVGGFELEETTSPDEDVEEVGLREGVVGDGDLEFEFGAGEAVGQFTLVNALVEKAAEVVVDGIDVLHDLVGEGLEVLLGDAGSFNGAVDGHGFDIRWVDRERPGRLQGLAS